MMCAGHTKLPRSLHFELPRSVTGGRQHSGGFSEVFRCESGGREVAVKALRLKIGSQEVRNASQRCRALISVD